MWEELIGWLYAAMLYGQQYPRTLLLFWSVLVLFVVLRLVAKYRPGDQIQREFRKVGIYPSEQQADALRDDFARIAAEGARKGLEERLKHQGVIQRDKEQVAARVAEISTAHVAVIREVGATLQAIEVEYIKYRKSLASDQAKEALRLIVEKAVAQITEMADASSVTLPHFTISDAKVTEIKVAETKTEDVKATDLKGQDLKISDLKIDKVKLNGTHRSATNGDAGHY